MTCIITIELGTNSVRIYAYDIKGNIIGFSKGYCPTIQSESNYSEQDPEQVLITMLYVLKNLLNEKIHPKKINVSSICFSACMHSLLAVDNKGNPIGHAITWADNRAKNEAKEIKHTVEGKNIYKATGTPIHPMSPLVKIAWIKKNDRERYTGAAKFLSLKSYILQQLTGECSMDYSMASATGLLNIHSKKWEPEALYMAGITENLLPTPIPIFATAGKLKPAYQNILSLSENTKIIVGSSDGCMATLGDGAKGEGKASITIEDSGAVRMMGEKVLQDEQERFFNYLLTEDIYVSGGPTNNGGVIFEWYTKLFGDFKTPFDNEHSMQELIVEASNVAAGAEGLLFLPYLLGERAPLWCPDARGAYIGLNIKHEKKHFVRAAIEGIIFEIYSIGKMLEEHRRIEKLSINGSFGTIPFCTQMLADIFNKPVYLRPGYDSVSFGTYMVAATEMGVYKTLDEATSDFTLPRMQYPDKNSHAVYAESFAVFEKLTDCLSGQFEAITQLQNRQASNTYLFADI